MQTLSSSSAQPLRTPRTAVRLDPALMGDRDAAEVVVETKLFVPKPREAPIARPRLQGRAHDVLTALLTLVVAPAGWGKTTLIAQWVRKGDLSAGWISLDRADDDIMRFWRYLLLAARQGGGGAGSSALHRLDGAGVDVERDVLPVFLNELAAAPGEVVVVLDDYHLVTNPAVHASIVALLEHAPPQLHLVLGARSDPPLPLSRLRVRGEMQELRAEQLRFTADEAAELLNRVTGPALSPGEVQRLVTRTEGWAAGLQLAALRLADRPDGGTKRSDFIDRFTGADRHIVDYLGEEVLANLPDDVRDFLLRTSVLNRVCASAADSLTGRDDGARMLDEIYRANLFLAPLDDELRWFRYHHLFREILRHELNRVDPSAPRLLHRRAADWYAAAGDVGEAIGHAIASTDTDLAGRLIADGWRREFNAGHLRTVQKWLDALPAQSLAADTQLTVAQVWLALDAGRLDEAGAAVEAAEQCAPGIAHIQVLRALHTYKIGDIRAATRMLSEVVGPVADPFLMTVRELVNGVCALWLGEFDRSRASLRDAAAAAQHTDNRLAHIYAMGCQALLAVLVGDLASARDLLRDADAEVTDVVGQAHFVAMFPALARARLAAAVGDPAGARSAADMAAELANRGAGRVEVAAALVTAAAAARATSAADDAHAAHAAHAADDAEAAKTAAARLAEARSVLRLCPDPGPVLLEWLATEQRAAHARRQSGTVEKLTERERAILAHLPGPLSQRQIAGALFVTPNTLKTHLRAIYRKLGADSRNDAVLRARSLGLL